MGELGQTFIKLIKFKNEQKTSNTQKVRVADVKDVANAAVKTSRLYPELNMRNMKHFDSLHEHMGMIIVVYNAFANRSRALLSIQTLILELSTLNSRVDKLPVRSFSRRFCINLHLQ